MASIRKNKSDSYEARITQRGLPSISKSFKTRKEAELWARKTEAEMDRGKCVKSSGTWTVAQAIAEYLISGSNVVAGDKYNLKVVNHDLGGYYVAKLTKALLENYVKRLQTTRIPPPASKRPKTVSRRMDSERCYSASTVRQYFFSLKKALVWHAENHGYALPSNLFTAKLPGCWETPRDRRLMPGELKRLLDAAGSSRSKPLGWQSLIKFALETCMRNQEMILARWGDLTKDGKSLVIPAKNCKTNKMRSVPLSIAAREIIEELRARAPRTESGDLIFWEFEGKPDMVSTLFIKIKNKASMPDLRFHDLRHEAISSIAESGKLSITELMKMSGHDRLETFLKYANLFPNVTADKLG